MKFETHLSIRFLTNEQKKFQTEIDVIRKKIQILNTKGIIDFVETCEVYKLFGQLIFALG